MTRDRRGRDRIYGSWIYNNLCNECLSPLTFSEMINGLLGVLRQHYPVNLIP
jgi:hypothetical protein